MDARFLEGEIGLKPGDELRVDGLPSPAEVDTVNSDDWETPCPKRDDKIHCNCWYDSEPCCACEAD